MLGHRGPQNIKIELSSEVYRCPAHLPRTPYLKTYRDQCYYFVNQERYWSDARDDCHHRGGGHHVIIKDQDTQNFVMTSLQHLNWNKNGLWIGAHDLDAEGDWKWVTGMF
ncbi:hypothetical protein KUTeg_001281 [Tegillarca granosa]|uniref:C-type lectin domain-containing protein n=1 Tax=Tegillarca granosa TaxID=220873 RepID=A0ABQ9FV97_TEGGR|nr:hypothetical protein KUTeg_001281 [Tegillarca granosa]